MTAGRVAALVFQIPSSCSKLRWSKSVRQNVLPNNLCFKQKLYLLSEEISKSVSLDCFIRYDQSFFLTDVTQSSKYFNLFTTLFCRTDLENDLFRSKFSRQHKRKEFEKLLLLMFKVVIATFQKH